MKGRIIFIIVIIIVIILYPFYHNAFHMRNQVYYIIEYDVNVANEEVLINKVENFDFPSNLVNEPNDWFDMKDYIDGQFVQELRESVEDSFGFRWDILYQKHLEYYFNADLHSKLNLTYNNNTIYEVNDANGNTVFTSICDSSFCMDYGRNWYINFSQVPYVADTNKTISLMNVILVRQSLDYGYYCGWLCALGHEVNQYIVLNSTLEVILVYIPYVSGWIS